MNFHDLSPKAQLIAEKEIAEKLQPTEAFDAFLKALWRTKSNLFIYDEDGHIIGRTE